jgi:IclR family transcriptional regulator, KDG regulon repressor
MPAVGSTSLRRGLAILFVLGGDEAVGRGGLGVTRIAELVGGEKSQVSRALKVLAEHGLVEREPDTLAYRLSRRLFALAARAADERLLDEARPVLRRLVDELEERAHLSVLQGADVLTLRSESPPHAVQAAGWVGRIVPVHCTSAGRALLCDHTRDDLASLLAGVELASAGPNAPRDADELYDRVAAARTRGYAVVDEELEPGLVAVAAPVRGFDGRIVAAVNVSAPKFRFGRRLRAAGEAVKAAADELSGALAGRAECAPLRTPVDSPR